MSGKSCDHAVAVVGGGAAGIIAAISARRSGASVVICERMPRPGKKILASGNGRCNLLNEDLSEKFYNPGSGPLVKSVFAKFGKDDILDFFNSLGLKTFSDNGRIFPVTNQSSSVLKVLEIELKRLSIPVEPGFEVTGIDHKSSSFIIHSGSKKKIMASSLVLATGGKSYPALGSDGKAFALAQTFGHEIIKPVPSAVPLIIKDPLCHILQGQKIQASATAVIGGIRAGAASGEVLFTKYGLSGTAILDISREISVQINRHGKADVKVILDMVPSMVETELIKEIENRIARGSPRDEMLAGILPNKCGAPFAQLCGSNNAKTIAKNLKAMEFKVTGTRGWNEADFTAGGVEVSQISAGTLESKLKPGLFFAGEVLDVDGCRGGYNLAWAWASGFAAGNAASKACR